MAPWSTRSRPNTAPFSYVLFSHYLDPDNRNDRVIANQWDLTMALCEGTVDAEQLAFLRNNVPKQEAGRVDSRVLVLSRANRSARTFDYVVDELTAGRQPCIDVIAEVGLSVSHYRGLRQWQAGAWRTGKKCVPSTETLPGPLRQRCLPVLCCVTLVCNRRTI